MRCERHAAGLGPRGGGGAEWQRCRGRFLVRAAAHDDSIELGELRGEWSAASV